MSLAPANLLQGFGQGAKLFTSHTGFPRGLGHWSSERKPAPRVSEGEGLQVTGPEEGLSIARVGVLCAVGQNYSFCRPLKSHQGQKVAPRQHTPFCQ